MAAVALAAILAVALGLRLFGIAWDRGFPFTPHPDERAILMKVGDLAPPALDKLGLLLDAEESPWNPRWFPYGSFPLYLLKGLQLAYSALADRPLHDLRVLGRAVSALADTATVALVFALGRRMYDRRTGLLAAAMTAMAVVHIQLSHFFAVDTLLALFATAAVFFAYRVARDGRRRDSLVAGALVGLGLATKVSLLPIYGTLLTAHLLYALGTLGGADDGWDRRLARAVEGLFLAVVASIAVLFVAQPYAFLDWSRFLADVVEQSEMVRRVRDYPYTRQYIGTPAYWYQVKQLAVWGLGLPLGVLAWAGLVRAALGGMSWRARAAYLLAGIGLPMGVLLVSASFWGIAVASALALVSLLGSLALRSSASRREVLALSWVLPYFLVIGVFQVKFLRYLLPITPFLLLFGARAALVLWERASAHRALRRPVAWVLGAAAVATVFYALAYVNIYRQPHTAVRAARWLNENARMGSVVLKEHWEEGLPDMRRFVVRELPLYDPDTDAKWERVTQELARADYLVFYSHRLYATISRLPERYPLTAAYYRLLFSGRLGFELVDFEATYPNLLGVSFVDSTFGRAGLPEPDPLRGWRPSPLALPLGWADESFTVYDHPKVLVFENTARASASTLRLRIEAASRELATGGPQAPRREAAAGALGLMMSPELAEAQQSGGTWADIVRRGSWTNRLPVLAWLLFLEAVSLAALPLALYVFRPLRDRGYLFAKALGILLAAFVAWVLASGQWLPFGRASVWLGVVALAAASGMVLLFRGREVLAFVRERRWSILLWEALFLAAFLSFVVVRMANPDLWHPFRGGEKPMDLAYLNAVLRSSYMPPYDPWFGGGYMNYYYWGQFLTASIIHATGIDPAVAFNLAVPTYFAMTFVGAFSVVYNLAEAVRRRLGHEGPSASTALAGLGGGLFVAVVGNLDGAVQVGQGAFRALFLGRPFGAFDFWRSSRMMPPDPPGFEITEFPFFTFLFADLHAHLIAIPFALLALGLALAVVLGAFPVGQGGGRLRGILRLLLLGLVVGALRLINTWDFPTYAVVSAGAVLLAGYLRAGGLSLVGIARSLAQAAFLLLVGYLAFLPYHLNAETFFDSVEATTNRTPLWQFLAIHGLFIFVVGSWLLWELRGPLGVAWRWLEGLLAPRRALAYEAGAVDLSVEDRERVSVARGLVVALGALLVGYVAAAVVSGLTGSTIPFAALLLALLLGATLRWLAAWRPDVGPLTFGALLVAVALALVMGLDLVRVEGDIDRMNSVFKFYIHVWTLLAIASAFFLWRLLYRRAGALWRSGAGRLWLAALGVLVASVAIYPVLGTQARLRDRFQVLPLTLDGTAFMRSAVYRDPNGPIELRYDYEGIRWLQDNVRGSPIVLEGNTPTYRWGGRISIYTGLPSVVGWQWHQEQQRWGYRWAVGKRIRDVERIYSTTGVAEALSLLRFYNVKYIYVGELERLYYPEEGLKKFEEGLGGALEKVYENPKVVIYRVLEPQVKASPGEGKGPVPSPPSAGPDKIG